METLIKLYFALSAIVLAASFVVGLFMIMDNQAQRRITSNDKSGMGFAAFGIVLALFSFGSALGAFSLNFRGYDLSGFLTVLAGSLSGFLLGWGVTILLPNSLTDRFLDQKHVWKLAAIVALVLTVATLVLR